MTADQLFSTLDTVVRKISFREGGSFLLSDTVGFIRKLPPELVAAFRATLEEVSGAGVVGEQPVLYPGDGFEYSSGAHLNTPWGSMQGHYEFEDAYGDSFAVPIPKFDLKADFTLQ